MISFKTISHENLEAVLSEISCGLSKEEYDVLCDISEGFFAEDDEDVEYAICVYANTLIARIFDTGRYFFLFPFELSERCDLSDAIAAMSEYAMREEIPFVVSCVPSDAIYLFSGFRHMILDAEDPDAEFYKIKVETECMLADEIPEYVAGRVKLNALSFEDEKIYAELCRDKNVNKYWGYDYSDDKNSPDDSYFIFEANREFMSGVAISLAVRCDGAFAGHATLYAFDGRGSAEFAIRLLPKFQGRGIASEAFEALANIARGLGLVRLRAEIMKENKPSLAFADKFMERVNEDGLTVSFVCEFY